MDKDNNLGLEGFVEKEVANRMYELFQSKEYDFWSVEGISKRIKIDDKAMIEYILNSDKRFRMSWFKTKEWNNSYALSESPIKLREKMARLSATVRYYTAYSSNDYTIEYN